MKNAWDTEKGEKAKVALCGQNYVYRCCDEWRGLALAWVDEQANAEVIGSWGVGRLSEKPPSMRHGWWFEPIGPVFNMVGGERTIDSAVISLVLAVEKARKAKEKKP